MTNDGSGPPVRPIGSGTDADIAATWSPAQRIALLILCLAVLLDSIDITVVNVALPAVQARFGFSDSGLSWVVNAYLVPFGGLLLLGGRAGDLLGQRAVFGWGVAAFTAASLAAGTATDGAMLIAARAVQGAAAAFVVPTTLAILGSVFPAGRSRDRAFGVWGASSGLAGSLGLVVGGLLVGGPGWRWVFFVNGPIGAFLLATTRRWLPAPPRPPERSGFDVAGALTSTAGLSLLVYAVVQTGTHPWGSARTAGLLTGAAVLTGGFVAHEARLGPAALVPLRIFAARSVAGANVIAALCGSVLFATFYYGTLYEQKVALASPIRTGAVFLPLTVVFLLSSGFAPALVTRLGVRVVVTAGALLEVAGLALLARISATTGVWTGLIGPSLVLSLGFGVLFVPMTVAALAVGSKTRAGVAAAMVNVSRFVGGAVGLAVLSSLASSRTGRLARAGSGGPAALAGGFGHGFAVAAGLMGLAAVVAVVLLRADGRGTRVDVNALSQAGLDTAPGRLVEPA